MGQIGYALVPMIARGVMLGADQPVILHMLDIPPAAEALNGVKMELVDAAFLLLKGIVASTDAAKACKGVNVAVMVGGFPRKEGMERKDVMAKNVSIYKSQASALEQHAAPTASFGCCQPCQHQYLDSKGICSINPRKEHFMSYKARSQQGPWPDFRKT
ncbi:malate dehydrogenase, cytoplasmic-like isoform X2 [Chenopodium quinoa]|uniref:malate dehydrogenase, cytoplasmic-like isoform X2 n=1 Tax=Chenopodium quinoa TaxID=63459 RepID=UPI000B76FEAD|nr:malate dehydrogenase, cytoplasmic-like isoform X2 [Chenopodium quinoa]